MSKSNLNGERTNAGIPACHTVASHTVRPEFQPVILKWLIENVMNGFVLCTVSMHCLIKFCSIHITSSKSYHTLKAILSTQIS